MLKSLYGGSAALTVALLLASLFFYSHPSAAEPHSETSQPEPQTQNKKDSSATVGATEMLPTAAEVASAALHEEKTEAKTPVLPSILIKKPELKNSIIAAPQTFTATAYALHGRTSSGKFVARGLIAADRSILPLGTRVRLEAGNYSGEYLVADHGSAVRGHKIDIWVPSNGEAMRFGRRAVRLTVLNYGAHPATSRTTRTRRARR